MMEATHKTRARGAAALTLMATLTAGALHVGAQDTPAPPADAPPAVALDVPQLRWPHDIARHEGTLYIADGHRGIVRWQGNTSSRLPGVEGADLVATNSSGVLAFTSRRRVYKWTAGRITEGPELPESRFSDRPVDLFIDDAGAVYVAMNYGGVHVWRRGRRADHYPYPPRVEANEIAVVGSNIYVSGNEGVLLEKRGRRMQPARFLSDPAAAAHPDANFDAMYVDGTTLYVGENRRILVVDTRRGTVTSHRSGLFGQMRVIVPTGTPGRLLVGAQSDFAFFENGAYREVPDRLVFPEAAVWDPTRGYVIFVSRDGVTARDPNTGAAIVVRPVAVADAPTAATQQTTSGPASGGGSDTPRSGVSVQNMRAQGCGLIAAMAIGTRAQEAIGPCLREGQSVQVETGFRNGRARNPSVTGDARQCAARALRRLRVPAAGSCASVRFTVVHD